MENLTPGIVIREARVDDLENIVGFNRAMALETENKSLDGVLLRNGVEKALSDPIRARYFVAEVEGNVAGQTMVTVEWSDWRNAWFWWIQSVFVKPEYRRRGVFRALHAYVRDQAHRADGVCGLRLYVFDANRRAIETYERLGMTRTQYLLFEQEWDER